MRRTVAAVLLVGILACLSGCSGLLPHSAPSSWVGANTTMVVYLSWSDAHGKLTGTAQATDANPAPDGDPVTSSSGTLSGTAAGGKITLALSGSVGTATYSGTIDDSTLTLELPAAAGATTLILTPGAIDDYNKAVHSLQLAVQTQRSGAEHQDQADLAGGLVAGLPAQENALSAALAAARTQLDTTKAAYAAQDGMASAAAITSCSNSPEADAEHDGYDDTLDAADTLRGPLADLEQAHDTLSVAVGSLQETPAEFLSPDIDAQLLADTAMLSSAGDELATMNAYSDTISTDATNLDSTVWALPYC